MGPVIANKGEWIICPSGHRIARFARNVARGERLTPELFDAYGDGTKPLSAGDAFGICPICHSYFAGTDELENFIFLDGGRLVRGRLLVEGSWRG